MEIHKDKLIIELEKKWLIYPSGNDRTFTQQLQIATKLFERIAGFFYK